MQRDDSDWESRWRKDADWISGKEETEQCKKILDCVNYGYIL